jgi:redox-sensitive bicupin YhaK (pirin superfamily)
MNTVLHKANTRGHANHGWLNSFHTFSFASYMDPERMNFGALRVLNDDTVAPGMGFGTHPHANMEIVSIPLSGDLEHKDSMGTSAVIKQGDVQIMSAGTGIYHSEFNHNRDKEVKFLQIWVFPKQKDIAPRYGQMSFTAEEKQNKLKLIISPDKEAGDSIWINQDAWFHLGQLEKGFTGTHTFSGKGTGIYAFVLEGDITINGQQLNKRDGFGIWDTDSLNIKADTNAELLLMEVPMTV